MNLRDLRYLVALAEHKHFGRAATASFVSQPTLSTQIKKLEEELGVALVERTPRKVLLTEVGREIAQRAREVHDVEAELAARLDLGIAALVHAFSSASTSARMRRTTSPTSAPSARSISS